jgi:hypothetical protein
LPSRDPQSALDAFLSADPDRAKETRVLHVESINADITVREIDDKEMKFVQERSESKNLTPLEMNAEIVAVAMVDPDLTNSAIHDKFAEKYGRHVAPAEIVKDVLKPFEVIKIGEQVLDLSGAGDDAVTDAGN